MSNAAILLLALLLDALLGEPRWLWARLPHPAVLMGRAVAALERRMNRPPRRANGLAALVLLLSGAGMLGLLLGHLPAAGLVKVLLVAALLAQRSLADHVQAVAGALHRSLPAGRQAVAHIVGRDTAAMSRPQVARAAIESAAENFSDAVVAPAFWFLLFGLPGLLICKITNTADSMIGYRTARYEAFGKAAARFDDLLNWLPARLSAALIALAHGRLGHWAAIRRDAALHRSPNAGWPEAAMARVLGIALAGPRSYDGQMTDFPWVNPGARRDTGPEDIARAAGALWRSWALFAALIALLALV